MPARKIERLANVSAESVLKHTHKNWSEWIKILNAAGAELWSHKEIRAFLRKRYRLSIWWQSQVARGFEVAIGRKQEGRNEKGEATVTATKSFHVDEWVIWRALMSERGLEAWLQPLFPVKLKPGVFFETKDGFYGEVRTMMEALRVRLSWSEPEDKKKSYVQLHLVPRPGGKCILVFSHEKLIDAKAPARMRARWKRALLAVAELVEE